MWDHLKDLEGLEVRRLTNLARLLASVLASGALPSTMLKVGGGAWRGSGGAVEGLLPAWQVPSRLLLP